MLRLSDTFELRSKFPSSKPYNVSCDGAGLEVVEFDGRVVRIRYGLVLGSPVCVCERNNYVCVEWELDE